MLSSQHSDADPQRKGLSHDVQPTELSDHIQGASSHRPRPRQPERKRATNGTATNKRKEKSNPLNKGRAPGKSGLQEVPDGSSNHIRSHAVQTNVGHFIGDSFFKQSIGLNRTQHNTSAHDRHKRPLQVAKRKNAIDGDTEIRRPTNGSSGRVTGFSSPGDIGPGRKSGRLREKGPTTYTAKGDIIRGGKRVNDELHEQPFAKRVRYEM